jgi:hypothetical protein
MQPIALQPRPIKLGSMNRPHGLMTNLDGDVLGDPSGVAGLDEDPTAGPGCLPRASRFRESLAA